LVTCEIHSFDLNLRITLGVRTKKKSDMAEVNVNLKVSDHPIQINRYQRFLTEIGVYALLAVSPMYFLPVQSVHLIL